MFKLIFKFGILTSIFILLTAKNTTFNIIVFLEKHQIVNSLVLSLFSGFKREIITKLLNLTITSWVKINQPYFKYFLLEAEQMVWYSHKS